MSEKFSNGRAICLQDRARAYVSIQSMKILNLIHVMAAQAFYNWAMREIDPMHPDVPRILMRQLELADKANRVFA